MTRRRRKMSLQTEDGGTIDLNEEIGRIADWVLKDDDVPSGALLHVVNPAQPSFAGWCMVLVRNPGPVPEEQ